MSKYIFITAEGYTFQPDSTSQEPDVENLQVIGFGQGLSPEAALKDMLQENKHLINTNFNEVIAIKLATETETYHNMKTQ
jgi:hypothetical protein